MPILLKVFLQTIAAFVLILLITRLLEKEQLGELTFYEYIYGITIGNMAAALAIDIVVQPLPILVALITFSLLAWLSGFISLKSLPARKMLEGEPTMVIQNGKIMEKNMARIRYNLDDLLSQLRQKNIFNISDVEFAILEPNGRLSVLPKADKQPVTRQDLNLGCDYEGVGSEIILDGEVIYQNLEQNGLDEQWLIEELKKQGFKSASEVICAYLDTSGNLYVDKKDDDLVHSTEIEDKPKSYQ